MLQPSRKHKMNDLKATSVLQKLYKDSASIEYYRKELKMLYFDITFILIELYCSYISTVNFVCSLFARAACLHVIALNKNKFATNFLHFRYAFIALNTLISSYFVNFRTQYLKKYIRNFNVIYTNLYFRDLSDDVNINESQNDQFANYPICTN